MASRLGAGAWQPGTQILRLESRLPEEPDRARLDDSQDDSEDSSNAEQPKERVAEVIEALPQTLRDRGVDAVVSGMGC